LINIIIFNDDTIAQKLNFLFFQNSLFVGFIFNKINISTGIAVDYLVNDNSGWEINQKRLAVAPAFKLGYQITSRLKLYSTLNLSLLDFYDIPHLESFFYSYKYYWHSGMIGIEYKLHK
jgi:hypothetical protein